MLRRLAWLVTAFAAAGSQGFGDLSDGTLVLLALCGLIGGIGITALGPGGVLVGVCVASMGLLVYWRERRRAIGRRRRPPVAACDVVATIGVGVAIVSGLFGLGGPLLSVPLLVAAAAPMLPALGAAQAQSIVIAGTGTIGYLVQGAVSWPLALLVGIPELVGVLVGWKLAHSLPTHRLRYGLAVVLVALGPYLIVHNG